MTTGGQSPTPLCDGDCKTSSINEPNVRRLLMYPLPTHSDRRILGARMKAARDLQKAAVRQARSNPKRAVLLPRPPTGPVKYNQPATLSEAAAMMTHFDQDAYARYYTGNPCLDQLMTLSKFNVLRAFIQNFTLLGLSLIHI